MFDEILTMAQSLSGAEEGELPVLEALCRSAEDVWRSRLRTPLERCGQTFACAAAISAAAGLAELRSGGDVASFSAGDVAVRFREGGAGDGLRRAAERLMAPFASPGDLWLKGVRG